MASFLRDYTLRSLATDRANGIYPSVVLDGDFFCIRSITKIREKVDVSNFDVIVECIFDDQESIKRRPNEGGYRTYKRVTLKPLVTGTEADVFDLDIHVTLGLGQLYSERTEESVPNTFATEHLFVPYGPAVPFVPSSYGGSAKNIRLCIPMSETGGVFYAGDDQSAENKGAWLEKGMTEHLDYNGVLWFYNPNPGSVKITIAIFNRIDF